MNKSMIFAVRAMTMGAVASLGFGALDASAAGPSSQEPMNVAVRQYVVRFADLDLSNVAGATALYARLRNAARIVCGPQQSRELAGAASYRACMDAALGNAVNSVDRPLVSQYHRAHIKGDKAGAVQLASAN